MVSGWRHHRHDSGILPDSLPDAQHGSHSIHHRLLADVPRLLIRSYAMDLKRYGTRDWGWYVAFGILAVICSLIILWQPAVGALYAVYMISFAFLIIGFFRIMLSFELKKPAQARERVEGKERSISRISSHTKRVKRNPTFDTFV